jgi:25S rRNA (uracil2634-N3)-methyltransferase
MSHHTLNGLHAATVTYCLGGLANITLRRDVPKLAKSPPPPSSSADTPNPRYIVFRSFVFYRSDWKGYEHRMTKGARAHGEGKTGEGGEDRTWEFYLKDE